VDSGDLIDAVRAHRAVELTYRSRGAVGARVVHPHVVYRTSTGKLCMDGVQVGGTTTSGPLPGWRDFQLMRIVELHVLDAEFAIDPGYDAASPKYRHGLLASA